MKFFHISDLHIGKRLNELPLIEDQNYILDSIIEQIKAHKPDALLIAGDIYDKSIAPIEAVALFDEFLVKVSNTNTKVFIISGNHDSSTRLAFGNRFMKLSNIYIASTYNGHLECVKLNDEYGIVNIYLLPFIKPINVKSFYPEETINSYTDAIKTAIGKGEIDYNDRNVILSHQFITGSTTCDSEEINVGGLDNIDGDVFNNFDYVALGHIHKPQIINKTEKIRYSGSILKYSFSEASDKKGIVFIDIKEKGNTCIDFIELNPLHDLKEIYGSYNQITNKEYYKDLNLFDYYHIILTDEEDVIDAISKLRLIYKNLLKLDYDNTRTRTNSLVTIDEEIEKKSPFDLFSDFYKNQNNKELSEKQSQYIKNLIDNIWEEEK